jgi:hypothetical protein
MSNFLIISSNGTSEWKQSFVDVQIEMNNLESQGIVSNVNVQNFINNKLNKSFTYDFDGLNWEKRN